MSTALITQDMSADYSVAAAAAGVTLPNISDFDLFTRSGLVDYWDFSEGAGATINGQVNGVVGSIIGAGWAWSSGKGLVLPAAEGVYAQLPSILGTDYEVTLLTKMLLAGAVNQTVIGPYDTLDGASMFVNPNNTRVQAQSNGATTTKNAATGACPTLNLWRILSMSRSTTVNVISCQTDITATVSTQIVAGDFAPSTTGLTIGKGVGNSPTNNNPCYQQIKGLMIHNRQLTPSERSALYAFLVTEATAAGIVLGAA